MDTLYKWITYLYWLKVYEHNLCVSTIGQTLIYATMIGKLSLLYRSIIFFFSPPLKVTHFFKKIINLKILVHHD